MDSEFRLSGEMRPRVIVSRCLTGNVCRWDGKTVRLPFLERASEWIEFVPVCPEMEIGLGCPRSIIRLTLRRGSRNNGARSEDQVELIQPKTGRRLTGLMAEWSEQVLRSQSPDGFLLKYKSPSCGLTNVRVYARPRGRKILYFDSGLFAAKARQLYPRSPAIDDFRLSSPLILRHWLTGIFAIRRFRNLFEEQKNGLVLDSSEETQRRLKSFDDFYRPLLAELCPILSARFDELIGAADILQYFDVLLSILNVQGRSADYRPYFPEGLDLLAGGLN